MQRLKPLMWLFCQLCVSSLWAQMSVDGWILDKKTRQPLAGVNVAMKNLPDTSLLVGDVTDELGRFSVPISKEGSYKIEMSFVGYQTMIVPQLEVNGTVRLDSFFMAEDSDMLKEVVVEATILRVVQKGDTTEFNAAAFKTFKGANAEDLVKKMPGFVVENGKVKSNGEEIKRVTIDGKTFLGDDATAALRNTPADIVDKVQVFEFGNDMLFLFGGEMDFGNKGLNIVTKKGLDGAWIANAEFGAGADTDDLQARFIGKGNINHYRKNSRFAAMWNVNNINVRDFDMSSFSFGGGGGGGGRGGGRGGRNNPAFAMMSMGAGQGITDLYTGGLAYTSQVSKKLNVTITYFGTYSETNNEAKKERTFYTTDPNNNNFLYFENTTDKTYLRNHRLNTNFTIQIDSNQRLIIAPNLSFNQSDNRSIFDGFNYLSNNDTLNRTSSNGSTLNGQLNPSGQLSYSRKFKKIGRRIGLDFNGRGSNQTINDGLLSTNLYPNSLDSIDYLDQLANTNNRSASGNTVINYYEPIALGSVLQVSYNNTINWSLNDKLTNNFDSLSDSYNRLDTALSNNFNNTYILHRVGLGYSYKSKEDKVNIEANLAVQQANLMGSQTLPNDYSINRPFINVLPTAGFRYKFNKFTNLRIGYRTSTNPPQASQLQNVVDNSNPLLLTAGNPDLKQTYTHNLSFRFSTTNPKTARNFSFSTYSGITQNYITNYNLIASQDTLIEGQGTFKLAKGAQLSFPVNTRNYYYVRTYTMFSSPIKKIKSNANAGVGANFTQSPGIINGALNISNNYNLDLNGGLTSNISEKVDFNIYYWGGISYVYNSLSETNNSQFYRHNISANLTCVVWKGLTIVGDFSQNVNTGLGQGFNQSIYMLGGSVGYKFMKDQSAEVKLSVFDALKQNRSVNRNLSDTYWEDATTQVLTRYVMLRFTYNLRKYKIQPDAPQKDGQANPDRPQRDGQGGNPDRPQRRERPSN